MENYSVVIIEDEPFLSSMYTIKFELEGFRVLAAGNGEGGLTLVKENEPDVILLDVVMPKLDGFEVLAALRSDSRFSKVPVILLTNLGQQSDIERGLSLGASDYIVKSNYTPSQVVEKVKEHLKIK